MHILILSISNIIMTMNENNHSILILITSNQMYVMTPRPINNIFFNRINKTIICSTSPTKEAPASTSLFFSFYSAKVGES